MRWRRRNCDRCKGNDGSRMVSVLKTCDMGSEVCGIQEGILTEGEWGLMDNSPERTPLNIKLERGEE